MSWHLPTGLGLYVGPCGLDREHASFLGTEKGGPFSKGKWDPENFTQNRVVGEKMFHLARIDGEACKMTLVSNQ